MANKRNLKRNINYICSELLSEAVAASMYSNKINGEDVKAIIAAVLVIHNDYVRRVSHLEPGMKPKQFYKNLVDNFNNQVSEIVDQIVNLG